MLHISRLKARQVIICRALLIKITFIKFCILIQLLHHSKCYPD